MKRSARHCMAQYRRYCAAQNDEFFFRYIAHRIIEALEKGTEAQLGPLDRVKVPVDFFESAGLAANLLSSGCFNAIEGLA